MASRIGFVSKRPKPKKTVEASEPDWLTVPKGKYLVVQGGGADWRYDLMAGTKYRHDHSFFQALEAEDGPGRTDIFFTAPYAFTIQDNEEEEDV